jgi:hypothetical protein
VAEDYKNPSQLKTWNYMSYGDGFAPSRHWATGSAEGNNRPINRKFQGKNDSELDELENNIEQGQIEQVKKTYNIHENNQDDSQEQVDPKELKQGDGIRFLKEFYIGEKKVTVNSKGIFQKKENNGFQVKMKGDDKKNQYTLIPEENMVVSRTGYFGCTAIVNKDRSGVDVVDCKKK